MNSFTFYNDGSSKGEILMYYQKQKGAHPHNAPLFLQRISNCQKWAWQLIKFSAIWQKSDRCTVIKPTLILIIVTPVCQH
jgi:hypothetical protein